MKKAFAVTAICFAVVVPALAQSGSSQVMSAEQLRSFCVSTDAGLRKLCGVYILGIVEGIGIGKSALGNQKLQCIPDSLGEADVVKTFMVAADTLKAAYPTDLKAGAAGIVGAAFANKYPCLALGTKK